MNPYKDALLGVFAVVFLYVLLDVLGVGCPIKFITGISCAGCGMTRAWINLLSGDIKEAFIYHPLWFVPIPIAILIIFRPFKKKLRKFIFGLAIVLFLAVYIIRLIYQGDEIVVIEPQKGLLYKILVRVLGIE